MQILLQYIYNLDLFFETLSLILDVRSSFPRYLNDQHEYGKSLWWRAMFTWIVGHWWWRHEVPSKSWWLFAGRHAV